MTAEAEGKNAEKTMDGIWGQKYLLQAEQFLFSIFTYQVLCKRFHLNKRVQKAKTNLEDAS